MTDAQTLKRHGWTVLDWIDRHWNLERLAISFIACIPVMLVLMGAALGGYQAHAVDSAAEVVPEEAWMELITAGDFSSPLGEAILIGALGAVLAVAEFVGRIVFAYLQWMPRHVWWAVGNGAALIAPATMILNLAWAIQQAYRSDSNSKAHGEIHG